MLDLDASGIFSFIFYLNNSILSEYMFLSIQGINWLNECNIESMFLRHVINYTDILPLLRLNDMSSAS